MIGFIGLSHLGLNYSLATAAKGFEVFAFDPDAALVDRVAKGEFPIDEPGFLALYEANKGRIRYTSRLSDLAGCDLVFYALDVRTNDRNESDLAPLTQLIEATAPGLSTDATIVVMSQVRPGFMRALVSRLRLAPESWLYQVETLIFGSAVQRAMEPERFIVGMADPARPVPPALRAWQAAFGCPVLPMRFESAELAKIAINLYLVSSVSTTNTLAEVCEAIGADWSEIAPALRLDRRIGPHAYLNPGLGIAGGNLERDLVTVKGLSAQYRTESGVVDAWLHNSAHAKSWARRILQRELLDSNPAPRVALWGLAYKQDTHSVKNSASIELIRALPGCQFQAFDPVARVDAALFPNLVIHAGALGALADADALVIMTPWKEFSSVAPARVKGALRGTLLVDPYAVLRHPDSVAAGLRCFQIGRA
jgi:UDPglucose 6-dehydrogenase